MANNLFHLLIKSKIVNKLKHVLTLLRRFFKKHRVWILLSLLLVAIMFAIGYFAGAWRATRKMQKFPEIAPGMRLLIVSPHPDDEILMAGGLIQKILSVGGEVKIIFLTSGDGSRETVSRQIENPDYSPGEYMQIGEMRMHEAINADTSLGVNRDDVVFLGFPDGDLNSLYYKHFSQSDGVFTSQMTKVSSVPYDEAYKKWQSYLGKFVVADVSDIIQDFKPNIVVTTLFDDGHPDHRTAFYIVQRAREGLSANWPIYASVVHYNHYPTTSGVLVPPTKIFGTNWYSLELTDDERKTKLIAGKEHASQYANPIDKALFDNLSARNEIFEKE